MKSQVLRNSIKRQNFRLEVVERRNQGLTPHTLEDLKASPDLISALLNNPNGGLLLALEELVNLDKFQVSGGLNIAQNMELEAVLYSKGLYLEMSAEHREEAFGEQ